MMKLIHKSNLPLLTGLTIGLVAAAAQAFFQVQPPEANGICLIGHPRDLVNYTSNSLTGTTWPINEGFIKYPALTAIGVVGGAFIAAYRSNELQLKPGPVKKRFSAFMFGFLLVNFGLLWGACPIRTSLLVSYGNMLALVVLVSIAVGVLLALLFVRLRVRKKTFK
jgi:hypothetical protein